jgi:hypothetical protein
MSSLQDLRNHGLTYAVLDYISNNRCDDENEDEAQEEEGNEEEDVRIKQYQYHQTHCKTKILMIIMRMLLMLLGNI